VRENTEGLYADGNTFAGAGEFMPSSAWPSSRPTAPAAFDVIVTEDMFGDILSDLAGELAGSLGMAGSLNASDHTAMAQAAHGSAPDIAGQDIANPASMILSAALLLRWLAVVEAISAGSRTPDLGGTNSTSSFTAAVVKLLGERP
jgi:3-isopropylmalate dehydrogenase